jgi:hypothetical protein
MHTLSPYRNCENPFNTVAKGSILVGNHFPWVGSRKSAKGAQTAAAAAEVSSDVKHPEAPGVRNRARRSETDNMPEVKRHYKRILDPWQRRTRARAQITARTSGATQSGDPDAAR